MVVGKKLSKGQAPCVIGNLRCHNITLLQDCDISGAGGRPIKPGEGRNYPEATAMGMIELRISRHIYALLRTNMDVGMAAPVTTERPRRRYLRWMSKAHENRL